MSSTFRGNAAWFTLQDVGPMFQLLHKQSVRFSSAQTSLDETVILVTG